MGELTRDRIYINGQGLLEVLDIHFSLRKPPTTIRVPYGRSESATVLDRYWHWMFEDIVKDRIHVVLLDRIDEDGSYAFELLIGEFPR